MPYAGQKNKTHVWLKISIHESRSLRQARPAASLLTCHAFKFAQTTPSMRVFVIILTEYSTKNTG